MIEPGSGLLRVTPLLLLFTGCVQGVSAPTSCDGLADKKLGITREDYSDCAGEILAALESMEKPLREFVQGDAAAEPEADTAHRTLRHLMRQVGFQEDIWREAAGGASRTVERWPDSGMRYFNAEVGTAAAQFNSALRFPNKDNLQEGSRRLRLAKRAYASFR